MILLALLLAALGVAFLCWALFQLSVYALPFFLALTVGFAAARSGSGPLAAVVLAVVVGVFSFLGPLGLPTPLFADRTRHPDGPVCRPGRPGRLPRRPRPDGDRRAG